MEIKRVSHDVALVFSIVLSGIVVAVFVVACLLACLFCVCCASGYCSVLMIYPFACVVSVGLPLLCLLTGTGT